LLGNCSASPSAGGAAPGPATLPVHLGGREEGNAHWGCRPKQNAGTLRCSWQECWQQSLVGRSAFFTTREVEYRPNAKPLEAIRSSCAHRDQKAAKAAPDSAWQASNPTPVARCSLLRPLTSLAASLGHAQGSQPSLEGLATNGAADVRTNNVLLSTPADPLATSGLE
jgi:hypothetical protein